MPFPSLGELLSSSGIKYPFCYAHRDFWIRIWAKAQLRVLSLFQRVCDLNQRDLKARVTQHLEDGVWRPLHHIRGVEAGRRLRYELGWGLWALPVARSSSTAGKPQSSGIRVEHATLPFMTYSRKPHSMVQP